MGNTCFKGKDTATGKGEELREAEASDREETDIEDEAKDAPSQAPPAEEIPVKKSLQASAPKVEEPLSPSTVMEFRRFSVEELLFATNNFSEENIVSEGGKQARNIVYKGRLRTNGQYVAVKRFQRMEWEDAHQFSMEALTVGKVRYEGLSCLLGYSCENDYRLLVAEYMPNSTLARHLFHWQSNPMSWSRRFEVAVEVAKTLLHLNSTEGLSAYHDLNPYRILFDKNQRPKLSCFGLLKPMKNGEFSSNLANIPPEYYLYGRITAESVVYTYGVFVLALFSGKSIRPSQFLELVANRRDVSQLVDSNLLGQPGLDQAMELVPLMAECLKNDPGDRPDISTISQFLFILQHRSQSGNERLSPDEQRMVEDPSSLPFPQAAAAGDMDSIYSLLLELTSSPPQEPSFETWNKEMQEVLISRQKGDKAFKSQLWEEAIACYNKFEGLGTEPLPLVNGRRCVAFLQLGRWSEALADAIQMQRSRPTCPEAKYLQAVAMKKMGLEMEAESAMREGFQLDAVRGRSSSCRKL